MSSNYDLKVNPRLLGEMNLPGFCPYCHWVKLRCEQKFPFQIPMPGIFASIDSHVKNVVHAYLDRTGKLPAWYPVIGDVIGYEMPPPYSIFSIVDPVTRTLLRGVADELLRLRNGSLIIVDYKTARFTSTQDELFPMYEVQLNCYSFIAERTHLGPVDSLWLIYCEPETQGLAQQALMEGCADHLTMDFTLNRLPVENRAAQLVPDLLQANRAIWELKEPPEGTSRCKNCELLAGLLKIINNS